MMPGSNVAKKKKTTGGSGLPFRKIRYSVCIVLSVVLALCGVRYVLVSREAASLQKQVTALREHIAGSKKANQVAEMEREWAEYRDKINIVSQLAGMRSSWGEKVALVPRALPAGLALDFVSVAASGANTGAMTMETMVSSGGKNGYGLADNFIAELKRTGRFGENTKINYVDRASVNGKDVEVIQVLARFS